MWPLSSVRGLQAAQKGVNMHDLSPAERAYLFDGEPLLLKAGITSFNPKTMQAGIVETYLMPSHTRIERQQDLIEYAKDKRNHFKRDDIQYRLKRVYV